MGVSGQKVFVTGATGGLGRVIAQHFVAAGAEVVLHGRDEARVAAAVAAITGGGRVRGLTGELRGDVGELVARARELLGGLDGVVNNAAVQPVVPFAELTGTDFAEMAQVNLFAAHDITRAAAAIGAHWVTHIASIEAIRPAAGHAHYAALKAALVMHAKAAALETAPMRVNAISPGLIHREGIEQDWPEGVASWCEHAPLGELIRPEDIAQACVFLGSPAARAITGHNLVVDGGMMATPGW